MKLKRQPFHRFRWPVQLQPYLSTLPIWKGPSLFLTCLPLNFCFPEFLPFSAYLMKFYVFTCFFLFFHYSVTTFAYLSQETCLRTLNFSHKARYYYFSHKENYFKMSMKEGQGQFWLYFQGNLELSSKIIK